MLDKLPFHNYGAFGRSIQRHRRPGQQCRTGRTRCTFGAHLVHGSSQRPNRSGCPFELQQLFQRWSSKPVIASGCVREIARKNENSGWAENPTLSVMKRTAPGGSFHRACEQETGEQESIPATNQMRPR